MRLRVLFPLAIFLAASGVAVAADVEAPKPLPADIVAAWKKAGAEVGWMSVRQAQLGVDTEGKPPTGGIPGFRLVGAEHLNALGTLPSPDVAFGLEVGRMPLRDVDLKKLARFKKLRGLLIWGTKITEAGPKELVAFEELRWLSIGVNDLTESGLTEVGAVRQLEMLSLFGSKITDRGLVHLAPLVHLQALNLDHTEVTDTGLKELRRFKSSNTSVQNQSNRCGRRKLRLTDLETLVLWDTQVTDTGIKTLRRFGNYETSGWARLG